MGDSVEDHLADLARDRYSPNTVRARAAILATIPNPLTIDRPGILEWWETRQQRRGGTLKAASSLAVEQSHVRAFYAWAFSAGRIDHNPGQWIPRARQRKAQPRPTREADYARLVRAADPPMRRMLALGGMAGLRCAEIAALDWTDVDSDRGLIWVRNGKGGKDRSVPLTADLAAILGPPASGPVIGCHVSPKAASARISRYLRANGVESTAHKLRARYATRFLESTGDLRATATVLGHSSVSTSERYTVASSDVMRRGAEAAGRLT